MEELRRGRSPFERVGRREYGYNIRQVDDFLTEARGYYNDPDQDSDPITSKTVRSMAFDPAKGGYEAQAVDAALDRLEDVFAQRERDQLIRERGEEAWLSEIGRMSTVLRARLHRPAGERFRRPSARKAYSYNARDVDALCDQLLGYFEQDQLLSVDVIRRGAFREARGRGGYEENQVDAFMDRVVELMASID